MKPASLKIFLLCPVLVLIVGFFLVAVQPPLARAQNVAAPQSTTDRCKNFSSWFVVGSGNNKVNTVGALPQFCSASGLAAWAVNLLLAFAGAFAVFFLILGGYFYMASAGNEEQAEKGKKMLIYSISGLAVIIMAYAIIRIVSNLLTAPK